MSFVRCLVVSTAQASSADLNAVIPGKLPFWIEKQNRFRAAQLGMEAEYIINAQGDHRPMRQVLDDLFAFCLPFASEIEESTGMQIARQMLDETPAYQLQLDAYEAEHSTRAVVRRLQNALLQDVSGESQAA